MLSIIQRNYFVISNLNNERLVRQSGSFLISGKYNVQLKGKIRQSIVKRAYSDVQDEFELQSFRIPAGRKSAILEELSFYNINEGTLFPELEHQMAYIKSNYANIQKPMADRFVKIEVPVTNIREVCDLDISDDKVDEIIQRVLRDEINPAFFDESYIAIQENLRIFLNCFFTGGVVTGKQHLQRRFLRKRGAAGGNAPPWGSCRAATEGL